MFRRVITHAADAAKGVGSAVAGFDWIRIGQKLGVPTLIAVMVLWGCYRIGMEAVSAFTRQAAADSAEKNALIKEMVTTSSRQGEATVVALGKMSAYMDDLRSSARRSGENDRAIISTQNRIASSVESQAATTRELLDTNKKVLEEIKKDSKR